MIIKSMSRKHASFAQLIDYIEGEAKLKSRHYSIFHNTYSRDGEQLKADFLANARHLRHRKNGVYLYHEVISITRSQKIELDGQKATLQRIVREYLNARGRHNMAYAVLHEDTEHLHFHIVMSANAVGERDRVRLSKTQFADIQTHLEKWVLREYPELEQKAVFHQNQTQEEREAKAQAQAKGHHENNQKEHLSDTAVQMKRRGAKTERRDTVQEQLTDIFETATNPRHFTDLMEKAGFTLYQRGSTHGITDREGNKYRLTRLGLSDAWHSLDERMSRVMGEERVRAETETKTEPRQEHQTKQEQPEQTQANTEQATQEGKTASDATHGQEAQDPLEAEAQKRLEEMKAYRARQAGREQAQTKAKNQDRDR